MPTRRSDAEHDKLVSDWHEDPDTEAADDVLAEPATTRAILVCRRDGETTILELAEGETATVGRAPDVTIRVDESKVSRKHATISLRKGALFVEDLGSRNGTLVAGRVLKGGSSIVAGGGIIRIAGCEIVVALTTGEPANATSEDLPQDDGLIVADPLMEQVMVAARKVARTPATVLILGETGVGKEVLAKRIHAMSRRHDRPMVCVNCAAIPETLLESTLFGHERGAFTGADRRKIGYVEAANGGTLFLDEIGELSPQAQVKLLRVLEGRTVTRVGGTAEIPVDVRVVCATHRDLQRLVEDGTFRADLYYRVAAFTLRIPPLRERVAEIAVLAQLFARSFARVVGDAPPAIEASAITALQGHDWPGNLRELRNAIEHATVMADGAAIRAEHLPDEIGSGRRAPRSARPGGTEGMRAQLAEIERQNIEDALAAEQGNQTRAARRLGISRRALVYKLSRYRRGD